MTELKRYEVDGVLVVCDIINRWGEAERMSIHLRRFGWEGAIYAIKSMEKFQSLRIVADQDGHPWNTGYLSYKRFRPEARTNEELERDGFAVRQLK